MQIAKADEALLLLKSTEWSTLVRERQAELRTQTAAIGLMAAQTCSAVVRLSPSVNHAFGALSELARNVSLPELSYAQKNPARLQARSEQPGGGVGTDRIDFLRRHEGPIRIIADAPLELLPVDGVPLILRYATARLTQGTQDFA